MFPRIEVFYVTVLKSSPEHGSDILIERQGLVDDRPYISAWAIMLKNGALYILTTNFFCDDTEGQVEINTKILDKLRQDGEIFDISKN